MKLPEWQEIVDEVESLWGRSGKWAHTDKIYKYAQNIPVGAARSAVASLFQEGQSNAPSPSEVLAAARSLVKHVASSSEYAAYCKTHGHLWGIVNEDQGIRTVICARCKSETTKVAALVPTAGDLEDGVYGRDIDDAALTDQIAP